MAAATRLGATARRILALGDSLTEGYYMRGYRFHPYTDTLLELLRKEKPEAAWSIANEGVSGERTSEMVPRLKSALQYATSIGSPYEHVVLLGGTNDLGYGARPAEPLGCLRDMCTAAVGHGARVWIMTVPECSSDEHLTDLVARRSELNSGIKHFPLDPGLGAVHVIDLHEKIPYAALAPDARDELWDDGLHLKPVGYDKMADIVFDAMRAVL